MLENGKWDGEQLGVVKMAPDTPVWAHDRIPANLGVVVQDDGGPKVLTHFDGQDGVADVWISRSLLSTKDGRPCDGSEIFIPQPRTLRQLIPLYPTLRPPVIHGLLRQGETGNINAASKVGKSWLVGGIAVNMTTCGKVLGMFDCEPGRVLILDDELHIETITYRLKTIAAEMKVDDSCLDFIDVVSLRGLGVDFFNMEPWIKRIEPETYGLVIADALFRMLPPGTSENDNGQMTAIYNKIDAYTRHLKSAWLNVHHASKGDQSGKATTDVGAGAGAQSRAVDCHLVIRPHKNDGVSVVDVALRSFAPVERFCIRWDFPLWHLDNESDPRKILGNKESREKEKSAELDAQILEDRQKILAALAKIEKPETVRFLRNVTNLNSTRINTAMDSLLFDEQIIRDGKIKKGNGQSYDAFTLTPKPEISDPQKSLEFTGIHRD